MFGGAVGGCAENYEEANIYHVQLGRTYGRFNDVKLALPVILPALIKLNWQDYFGGAAMAGVSAVIGENARDKDPNLKIENGKITEFAGLKPMLDAFRRYDRGYGQIVLQCNVEDDLLGLPEYAIREHGVEAIEFKFGQSAKGTQPARRLKIGRKRWIKLSWDFWSSPPIRMLSTLSKQTRRAFVPTFTSMKGCPCGMKTTLFRALPT